MFLVLYYYLHNYSSLSSLLPSSDEDHKRTFLTENNVNLLPNCLKLKLFSGGVCMDVYMLVACRAQIPPMELLLILCLSYL